MTARSQIALDPEMHRRARAKAAEQGISLAEYMRRLLAHDLEQARPHRRDISVVFDLVDEDPETNIARDKDQMIGQAVWDEHRRRLTHRRMRRG
jgi:hypothetical protein